MRCRLHRSVLRLPGEAWWALGPRAAAAHLREGPHRSGRSIGNAQTRPGTPGALSDWLSTPCLSASRDWVSGEARYARPDRSRGRSPLCTWRRVAEGRVGYLSPRHAAHGYRQNAGEPFSAITDTCLACTHSSVYQALAAS